MGTFLPRVAHVGEQAALAFCRIAHTLVASINAHDFNNLNRLG